MCEEDCLRDEDIFEIPPFACCVGFEYFHSLIHMNNYDKLKYDTKFTTYM